MYCFLQGGVIMKVYAFFNEKGGVGKTTSALAMLSYFDSTDFFRAGEGKRAVAIDMTHSVP